MLVHASCVALQGHAVLLMGASGAGKSDVALRLIDGGAVLVSDDQTKLHVDGKNLIATPPDSIAGLIEMRHAGLLRLPYEKSALVKLCIALYPDSKELERLPEPFFHSFLDCAVRGIKLPSYEASTPAKIRLALQGTFMDE